MKDEKNNNKASNFRKSKKTIDKNVADDFNKILKNKINTMIEKNINEDPTKKNPNNFTNYFIKYITHTPVSPKKKYNLVDFIKHKDKFHLQNNFDQNGAERFLIERDIALRKIILNDNIIVENSESYETPEFGKCSPKFRKNFHSKNKEKLKTIIPKNEKRKRRKTCKNHRINFVISKNFDSDSKDDKNLLKLEEEKYNNETVKRNSFKFSEEKKLLMKNSLESDENKFSEIYEDKKVSQFNPLYSKEGYKKIIKTIIANKNNIEKDITNLINNAKKKEKGNDSSKQTLIDIIFYLSEKK